MEPRADNRVSRRGAIGGRTDEGTGVEPGVRSSFFEVGETPWTALGRGQRASLFHVSPLWVTLKGRPLAIVGIPPTDQPPRIKPEAPFQARNIRDRRLGVQMKHYTARLLVRDADTAFGTPQCAYSPSNEWAVPKRTVGEWAALA